MFSLQYQTEPLTPLEVIYIANKAEDAKNSYNSIKFLEALLYEIEDGALPDSHVGTTQLVRMIASAYNRVNISENNYVNLSGIKNCDKFWQMH